MSLVVNQSNDRLADLIEELIDNINEALEGTTPAEVINELGGAMPRISVNVPKSEPRIEVNVPQMAAPAVNITPPQVTVNPRVSIAAPEMKAPDVHVTAPAVTVNPPKVTVEAPKVTIEHNGAKSWTFNVKRNKDGLIETITAKPS